MHAIALEISQIRWYMNVSTSVHFKVRFFFVLFYLINHHIPTTKVPSRMAVCLSEYNKLEISLLAVCGVAHGEMLSLCQQKKHWELKLSPNISYHHHFHLCI